MISCGTVHFQYQGNSLKVHETMMSIIIAHQLSIYADKAIITNSKYSLCHSSVGCPSGRF